MLVKDVGWSSTRWRRLDKTLINDYDQRSPTVIMINFEDYTVIITASKRQIDLLVKQVPSKPHRESRRIRAAPGNIEHAVLAAPFDRRV